MRNPLDPPARNSRPSNLCHGDSYESVRSFTGAAGKFELGAPAFSGREADTMGAELEARLNGLAGDEQQFGPAALTTLQATPSIAVRFLDQRHLAPDNNLS